VSEKTKFAGRARKWFFARAAIASFTLFVPLLLCTALALRVYSNEMHVVATERTSVKMTRSLVDASTSLMLFRDSLIAGRTPSKDVIARVDEKMHTGRNALGASPPLVGMAWKRVTTIWQYARRGRRREQAERALEAMNQAITLALSESSLTQQGNPSERALPGIFAVELPVLRAQLHAVSGTLIQVLHERNLTLKERIGTAVELSAVESAAARITNTYGMVARDNARIAVAETNNSAHLRAALDPLTATMHSVIEDEGAASGHEAKAGAVNLQFSRADSALTDISERTISATDLLLKERERAADVRLGISILALLVIGLLVVRLYTRIIEELRARAGSISHQEELQAEIEAGNVARKVVEQALAAKADHLRTVMEKAPMGIVTLDGSGTIIDANAYMRLFLEEDKLENSQFDLIGSYKDELLELLNRKRNVLNFERSFKRHGGKIVWADITISRMYDDASRLAVCMLRDITERKDVELRLHHEATHDGLTQLANRNLFRSTLSHMLAKAKSGDMIFAALFIDLDLFKHVNDTYGHEAGDVVLTTVAERLLALTGPADLVARFGGDEFAILLAPPSNLAKAEQISASIVSSLAEPIPYGNENMNIGSSIGLALGPNDVESAEELMRNADTAMYAAKKKGRGRYVIFDPEMQLEAQQDAQLTNDLQVALQDETQIYLDYVPIIGLKNNDIVGFEALARWKHPQLGEIPTKKFLKLAEQSSAMRDLGRLVMRTACRQLAELSESIPLLRAVTLSLNISSSELSDPNFVDSMIDVIRMTDFDPKRLFLEITETNMVLNVEQANRIISRLREFGIRVSIDDFGAGYSSLRYLQELQVDLLKIDHGFLRAGEWEKSGAEILRAIVNLAVIFDLPVVAGGVETMEQLDFVRALGCNYAQGEFWGKPQSIAGIRKRLSGKRVESLS
jgi:diguanylate cyclase (GGDEF)-like protein/PAS domain S-box-containing protein